MIDTEDKERTPTFRIFFPENHDPILVFYPHGSKMFVCFCSLWNIPVFNPTWQPLPEEL